MRFKYSRSRTTTSSLRVLAQHSPKAAEEHLNSRSEEWRFLAKHTPEDAADILEAIGKVTAANLLIGLESADAAGVLNEIHPEAGADLIEEIGNPVGGAALVTLMSSNRAADMVWALNEEVRATVIDALDPQAATELLTLLRYKPDTAGGLMTTEITSLPIGMPAVKAIELLRSLHDELGSDLTYVYVVDDSTTLLGVVSFRDLFFAHPDQRIDEVMVHDPITVTDDADREVVSELIQRYRLLALPVTNTQGHLIGVIKVSQALEAMRAEATEDIASMVGAGAEETVYTPVKTSAQRRLPWIIFNLVIGFLIASVIFRFEDTIAGNARLAAYMPMVALLAGNGGAQSLAVIIRAIAVGDLPKGRVFHAIRRELLLAIIIGITIALLSGIMGAIVAGDHRIGTIIGVAVFVNFIVAGLTGASIPVLLRRVGQDPALASAIFLTMITDIVGFGGFLATAAILL